jgi:hypothetical protein
MALTNFIPAVWSNSFVDSLKKNLVFGALANTDFQGDIQGFGSSVRINEVGPITVSSYTKDGSITIDTVDDAQRVLLINQQKYFAFQLDDIDQAQSKPKVMQAAMAEAAYAMKDNIDTYLGTLYAEGGINYGSTVTVSSTSAIQYLMYMGRLMDEANVPTDGRVAIVPPWYAEKLALGQFNYHTSNEDVLKNGFWNRVAGLDIYVSNNLSKSAATTACQIMLFRKPDITFAMQVNKVEAYRRDTYFADAVRGLVVYGAKVVRPNAVAVLPATRGPE